MKAKKIFALLLLVLTGLFMSTNILASEADFFRGKSMSFICPGGPGGGYDRILRSFAIPFQERLGVRVIIKNLPGAGGIRSANVLYKSRPNGLTLGLLMGTALVLGELGHIEGITYDFTKYSFIGRVTAEAKVLYVNPRGRVKTLDDFFNKSQPVKFGELGAAADTFVFLVGLRYAMNMPIEIVLGYRDASAIELAIMNGEVDAGIGAVGSRYPKIKAGILKPIALFGTENPSEPEYRNLPILPGNHKFIPGGEKLMKAMLDINEAHRVLAAPSGVPEKRRQLLEDTLYQTLNDPKVQKKWKKEGRVSKFMSGKDYLRMVQGIFNNPPQAILDAWKKEQKNIKY